MDTTVVPATPLAIVRYLESRGIEAPALLTARRYEFDDVVALWLTAEERARDPRIGAHVAELVPFGAFGAPEHLMVTSATLTAALERLVRFYPLVNHVLALSFSTSSREARIEVMRPGGGGLVPCYADFVLSSVRRRVDLALGFPSNALVRHNALVFNRDLLRESLPGADEELCATIEAVALQRIDVTPRTTDLVREMLAARPTDDLFRVARRLTISSRTLQRRLVAEGTTFRSVADSVRRATALRLLQRGRSIKEVTDAVGFDEVRSLHRAFRRWTGTTPDSWRAKSV